VFPLEGYTAEFLSEIRRSF